MTDECYLNTFHVDTVEVITLPTPTVNTKS